MTWILNEIVTFYIKEGTQLHYLYRLADGGNVEGICALEVFLEMRFIVLPLEGFVLILIVEDKVCR